MRTCAIPASSNSGPSTAYPARGVEVARPQLRVQLHLAGPGRRGLGVGEVEEAGAHPAPAGRARHGHALQEHRPSMRQQPAGAHDGAGRVERDQVQGGRVVRVALEVLGHPLLLAEHPVAQGEGGRQVVAGRAPDGLTHSLAKEFFGG